MSHDKLLFMKLWGP